MIKITTKIIEWSDTRSQTRTFDNLDDFMDFVKPGHLMASEPIQRVLVSLSTPLGDCEFITNTQHLGKACFSHLKNIITWYYIQDVVEAFEQ